MARRGGCQRLADDQPLEAHVQSGETTGLCDRRGADLVAAGAKPFEGAVTGQANELISGVGALVHLFPLEAVVLAPFAARRCRHVLPLVHLQTVPDAWLGEDDA